MSAPLSTNREMNLLVLTFPKCLIQWQSQRKYNGSNCLVWECVEVHSNLDSNSNTFPFIPLFSCGIPLSRKTKHEACLLLHREPQGQEVSLLPSRWLWVLYNSVHRGAASHSPVINQWATVQPKPERPSLSCHHTCFHMHTASLPQHEGWLGVHQTPGNASHLCFDNSRAYDNGLQLRATKSAEFHSFVITRDTEKEQLNFTIIFSWSGSFIASFTIYCFITLVETG